MKFFEYQAETMKALGQQGFMLNQELFVPQRGSVTAKKEK
jgi:hypothetical protein